MLTIAPPAVGNVLMWDLSISATAFLLDVLGPDASLRYGNNQSAPLDTPLDTFGLIVMGNVSQLPHWWSELIGWHGRIYWGWRWLSTFATGFGPAFPWEIVAPTIGQDVRADLFDANAPLSADPNARTAWQSPPNPSYEYRLLKSTGSEAITNHELMRDVISLPIGPFGTSAGEFIRAGVLGGDSLVTVVGEDPFLGVASQPVTVLAERTVNGVSWVGGLSLLMDTDSGKTMFRNLYNVPVDGRAVA